MCHNEQISIDPGKKYVAFTGRKWGDELLYVVNATDNKMNHYDLISIDPGKKHVAFAGWKSDELFYVNVLLLRGRTVNEILTNPAKPDVTAQRVVLEQMVFRPKDPRSNANDLIDVTTIGVSVAHWFKFEQSLRLIPALMWKGGTPKNIMTGRIYSKLLEKEKALLDTAIRTYKTYSLDLIDAVGIGLYALGRI